MASLYELTADVQLLWNLMEEGTLNDEDLISTMENSQEELNIKLENYCKWIKNMESDIEGLKAEEKRLAERRKTMENTIAKAKQAMQRAMETAGEMKVKGDLFTLSIQKNPPSVVMDCQEIDLVPEEFLKYKDPEINRTKLKEVLQGDDQKAIERLEGICHLEQSQTIRIK